MQRAPAAVAVLPQPAVDRLAVQAQRRRDILRVRALLHLIHGPQPQRFQRLVIQLAAVVFPHDPIISDHKIKVDLLMKSLVNGRMSFAIGALTGLATSIAAWLLVNMLLRARLSWAAIEIIPGQSDNIAVGLTNRRRRSVIDISVRLQLRIPLT
jgi:hypothetical protein